MFYTYIGEELIWKVRANNPYEQNSARSIDLNFRVDTIEEANEIELFFTRHIHIDYIENMGETKYSKIISVRNVFGNISRVIISWI